MDVLAAAASTSSNGSSHRQAAAAEVQGPSWPHNSGLSALLNAVTLQLNDERQQVKGHHLSTGTSNFGVSEQQSSFIGSNGHTQAPSAEVKRSFPGILMSLLLDDNNSEVLTFLPDGKFFAVLKEPFRETLLEKHFDGLSFDDFVEKLATHGFTRIEQGSSGLQVFRHKLFCKDDWENCARLLEEVDHGTVSLTTKASPLVLPPPRLVSTSTSDGSSTTTGKRRMSPSHQDDTKSDNSKSPPFLSQKSRIVESPVDSSSSSDDASSPELATTATCCSSSIGTLGSPTTTTADATNNDSQSRAMVIFEEKMSLNECSPHSLQQQAVAHATRNIVTGAIETLLRDEDHTRETFEKHNESLSKATVPGVTPIAVQLFSSSTNVKKKRGRGCH